MTRATKLRGRTRRRSLVVGIVVGITLGGGVAGAALSSSESVQVHAVAQDLRAQADKLDVLANATSTVPASTTTSSPATTTTVPSSGTIVPAGGTCTNLNNPNRPTSVYKGNHLTVTQAIQALWAGNFRTVTDLRSFVAIGRAESSLCPLTWNYHPEFGAGQADRGWLQISSHYWPQFPDSQVFDVIGAARAAHAIIYTYGKNYGEWNTASQIAALAPTVATVCAVEPATGC